MSSDDWEYGDNACPKCSNEMAWRCCNQCGGGGLDGHDCGEDTCCCLYPEDNERCDNCNGTGHEEWCRECGWDETCKQFLSPQYEAEWLAKQEAINE